MTTVLQIQQEATHHFLNTPEISQRIANEEAAWNLIFRQLKG